MRITLTMRLKGRCFREYVTKVFANTPQKKVGFPLEIFSLNMTKSSVSGGYGHNY